MLRGSGTRTVSSIIMIVAVVVVVLFPPLVPLEHVIHSSAWTRFGEWLVISALLIILASWAGFTDKDFDVTREGVKARRVPDEQSKAADRLLAEYETALRLIRDLRAEIEWLHAERHSLPGPGRDSDVR